MDEMMLKAKAWELAILLVGLMPEEVREGMFRRDSEGAVEYEFKPIKNIAAGLLKEIKNP